MEKKQIGKSELFVAPLAFGGNVLGWTTDEKTSFDVLDAFVAAGFNFIDTADIYSRWASGIGGESETMLGQWMKKRGNRKNLLIASKVGMDMGNGKVGLSKKYILKAIDESLKRLQTEYIDLYQSHRDDEKTPVEETLDAYQILIKEGKVRYIGASNFSAARLLESLEASKKYSLPRYECLQPMYNLCERKSFEGELQNVCVEQAIGVIPYYALASGFLTGKYRSSADFPKSVRGPGISKYLNPKGLQLLSTLDHIAEAHKTRVASVSLAWLMAQPGITAPIASATKVKHVEDFVKAVHIKLTAKELFQIKEASE